jgi:hypothetical protein
MQKYPVFSKIIAFILLILYAILILSSFQLKSKVEKNADTAIFSTIIIYTLREAKSATNIQINT